MRGLNSREKILLGLCVLTVFVVVNFFAVKWAIRTLKGDDVEIESLENQLADAELIIQDADLWLVKNDWLGANMPVLEANALGKAQGDLLQQLQDDLFKSKLKIDRQSLQESKIETDYTEVSVRFDIRGPLEVIVDWLTTLQSPEKFVVIKYLELELDNRVRNATEPQAKCEITIARWFRPDESDLPAPPPGAIQPPTQPETTPETEQPVTPETTEENPDGDSSEEKAEKLTAEVSANEIETTGSVR